MRGPGAPRILIALGLALLGATAAAGDRLFVSSFQELPDGFIERIEIPSGEATRIVTSIDKPEDGVCGPNGFIYFPEWGGAINRWDQDGRGERPVVRPNRDFQPEGLTFSPDGDLYWNTRPAGSLPSNGAWRLRGADVFATPERVAPRFANFGEGATIPDAGPHAGALLLVENQITANVHMSSPPGAPLTTFIDWLALSNPPITVGLVADGCGDLFVVTQPVVHEKSRILHFDAEGVFVEIYAAMDGASWGFLEIDSQGYVYVSDDDNKAVWRIAPDRTRSRFHTMARPAGVALCRELPALPCWQSTCSSGGPYEVACAGSSTCLELDATRSEPSPGAGPLQYSWSSDCPAASFSDRTESSPTLCFTPAACDQRCLVTVTTDDGAEQRSCTDWITVQDATPPTLRAPSPATLECTTPGGTPATDPAVAAWLASAAASDECRSAALGHDAPRLFRSDCAPGLATEVTFTARDECGNEATAAATLSIADTAPPHLSAPAPATIECSEPGGVAATDPRVVAWLGSARALDVCGIATLSNDAPAFFPRSCRPPVSTQVGFTATNPCDNSVDGRSSLTVTDTTAPVAVALLAPVVPRPPAPPRSPRTSCSMPGQRLFEVVCSAADVCDSDPDVLAELAVVNSASPPGGPCQPFVERVAVECGEVLELRAVRPACEARPPRSARPALSARSDGTKSVTGERFVLTVTATDDCHNVATAQFDPAEGPSPLCDERLDVGD